MTQYNGLTLTMLEDAMANWPEAVPALALPADGPYLVSDLAGSGLLWGRSKDLWWAFAAGLAQGPAQRAGSGGDQGRERDRLERRARRARRIRRSPIALAPEDARRGRARPAHNEREGRGRACA
jgi:hypothetical protein